MAHGHGHAPKKKANHMFIILLGLLFVTIVPALLGCLSNKAYTREQKTGYLIALIIVVLVCASPFITFFYIMRG
jgi:uncharacterized membrane-anchored protein